MAQQFSLLNVLNAQNTNHRFQMIDNYIYLHHTDEFVILPVFPDEEPMILPEL